MQFLSLIKIINIYFSCRYEESEAYKKKGDRDPRTCTFVVRQLINANKLNHSTKLTAQIVTSLVFCYSKIHCIFIFIDLNLKNLIMQYKFFCSCSLFWYRYSIINLYNRDQRGKSDFCGTTRRFNRCTRTYALFHLSSTSFRQETYILGMILFYIYFLYLYDSYINILIISSNPPIYVAQNIFFIFIIIEYYL